MHLKFCLFICLSFLAQLAQGQKNFVSGTLGLANGETMECEFVLQIKNGKDGTFNKDHKRLKYRMPGDKEVQKIDFDDLDYIIVNTEETQILLRRMHYYTLKRKGAKKSKDKSWCQYRGGCDDMQGYLLIQEFEVDSEGQIWESYLDGMGWYLLMREGEDAPTHVSYVFLRKVLTQKAFDKQRKRMLEKYFVGDKDGMAFVKGKKRITQKDLKDYLEKRCGE